MTAQNIDEVLERLREIVERSKATSDRLGLFAALYAVVTREVKRRIESGFFDDGARMNRLDTRFANRYLEAFDAFRAGGRPTGCWRVALEAGTRSDLIVLQHLLLGMNAHINLDLGIAAAELFSRDELPGVRDDFARINVILTELLERSQEVIARFSPLLGILDQIGGKTDEQVANFSIERARADAWSHAQILVRLEKEERPLAVDVMDRKAAFLGRVLTSPDPVLASGIRVIALTESQDVAAIVGALDALATIR
jgi:hypothetical protein